MNLTDRQIVDTARSFPPLVELMSRNEGRVALAQCVRALLATPTPTVAADAVAPSGESAASLYVECRQCDECGHIGINDSHDTDAACGYSCGWTGLSPTEDRCPGCGRENVMGVACPKCSGRYAMLAEAELPASAAPTPTVAADAVVPQGEKDAVDTLVAVLNVIGYTEEFAQAHPDLKVSEGVKLFLSEQAAQPDERAAFEAWWLDGAYGMRPCDIYEANDVVEDDALALFKQGWQARAASQATVNGDEPVAELVACRDMKGAEWFDIKVFDRLLPNGTKLYTRAAAPQAAERVGIFVRRSMFGPWIEIEKNEEGSEVLYRLAAAPQVGATTWESMGRIESVNGTQLTFSESQAAREYRGAEEPQSQAMQDVRAENNASNVIAMLLADRKISKADIADAFWKATTMPPDQFAAILAAVQGGNHA
jgi:hypothetical protein